MEGNQPNNEPPHNNMIRRPIPFFPGVFLQLMPQDILQESMNDETPDKPATKDFIDSLEEITVDQEMIDQNISCSICLDEFKKDDKCIKLPCENPHYFHTGDNKEICEGIKPWFKLNHNCPVCRHEFPEEELSERPTSSTESSDTEINAERDINADTEAENELMNRFNQLLHRDPIDNILMGPSQNLSRMILSQTNPFQNFVSEAIEREEDRQLQEAIRLSLENN